MSTYNKIVFNGQTLIDLSNDTVDSSDDIANGLVGHLNDGTSVTGTASGGGAVSDAVRFIDYDGTILHTYSAAQFAALNAMPANPSHTGLTAQGWNWTLADAKTHVADYGMLDIGQNYITNDGKTRVYISLTDPARLSPYLGICPQGTVVIDWGDNSATDTLQGSSLGIIQFVQHNYSSTGDYIITLTVTAGTFAFYGTTTSSNGSYFLIRTNSDISTQRCYQSAIKKVELGSSVSLGTYSFYYCFSLESVTIPSSVTFISLYAFYNCYSLLSLTIPSGITSLANNLFTNCYSLKNVSLPKSINSMGTSIFSGCGSLVRVSFPSGLNGISSSCFYGCYALSKVTIPNSVTSIGSSAFSSCYSLKNITLPTGLSQVSSNTFYYCYSLESIVIPEGVTSLGTSAFNYCRSLKEVTIPSTVTSIGTYAFQYCSALSSITLPSGLTAISSYSFSYCYSLENIIIPNGVTNIANSAFYHCDSLNNITLPNSLTSLDSSIFSYCYSLTNITLPSALTTIGTSVFANCVSLSGITIPSSVTSIGSKAFEGTTCLAAVRFLPTTPPSLGSTFAASNTDLYLYVPYSADHSILEAYQTATNYATYASRMIEESP